ncbi:MAG: ROK family protein [Nevskiaceae bacterium]|nr:MAG: ROK family protein [Nevskiaceae bacterium]TAM25671.1 MAG: ROK family protein [Nevskiaceae bacterium]
MRIGIDLGGTKTEAVLMGPGSAILARERLATPHEDYQGQIATIAELVRRMEAAAGQVGLPVGIGHPGTISPATGLMKNANSICLNGRPLKQDIEAALGRVVRMANDADCLAVSEAADGAAAGASTVFAAILGTGAGGGIVIHGRLLAGPNAIAGEWGHNPLPWPRADWGEVPGPEHWDGQRGSIEAWLSGTGFARDHAQRFGGTLRSEEILQGAAAGDGACAESWERYQDRLARALASVINLLDPEVIVLGGGLSKVAALYQSIPRRWGAWVFSDRVDTQLKPALHGDSSGVRGAAWLWPETAAR